MELNEKCKLARIVSPVMTNKIKLFAPILIVLLVLSCKKDATPFNFHYDYFPLQHGHYVTYSVDHIIIDDALGQDDTLHYFIKAKIGDTITDNEGRVARRYERYFRTDVSQPWVLQDIWTTIIDNGRAELMEENQRTIKMVFAPTKFKEWNCNAYNTQDALDCYYRDLHVSASINGYSFDSTVTVEQEDFRSLVDYRRKYEQYAKGVGMYYKHYKHLRILNGDSTNVVKGTEIYMRLTGYGIE